MSTASTAATNPLPAHGPLTITQNITTGVGQLGIGVFESNRLDDNLTVAAGVVLSSSASNVFLTAGDQVRLEPGSRVAAGGDGVMSIAFSLGDTDNIGGGYFGGAVDAANHIPQVSGGVADETLLIDFQAGASFPFRLLYDGGDGLNGLTLTDAGGSGTHLYQGAGTGVSRDLNDIINFSRIQNLTVIGGNGDDDFGFRPDASVTMHLVGGLPGSAPDDALFVNSLSAADPILTITSSDATGAAGHWSFSNRLPINFSGIDTFSNLTHLVYAPLLGK